jgi:hypothetical protein
MQVDYRSRLRIFFVSALACIAVVALGCGGGHKGFTVKGKVIKDGKMLSLPEGETLFIVLDTMDEARRVQTFAIYHPADGTFECDGLDGRGLPEGKMRIQIWPGKANVPPYNDYLFKGQFKGDKSPLVTNLKEANCQQLIVDVGAKTVTPP